jgi:hypothetical protein
MTSLTGIGVAPFDRQGVHHLWSQCTDSCSWQFGMKHAAVSVVQGVEGARTASWMRGWHYL